MNRIAALLFSTLALTGSAATAGEPAPILLREQGHLLDRHGVIVTSRVTLTFALYYTPMGGRPLWQERHTLTPVDGAFSILLGEARAFPPAIFDGGPLYLGVRLNTDPEVAPREELAGMSSALIASTSSHASPTVDGITPVALHSLWTQPSNTTDEAPPHPLAVSEPFHPALVQQVPNMPATPATPPAQSFRSAATLVASRLPPGDPHCAAGGTKLVTGADETYVCDGAFAVVLGAGESLDTRQVRPRMAEVATGNEPTPLRPPAAVVAPRDDSAEQTPPPETWITCGPSSCAAHAGAAPSAD